MTANDASEKTKPASKRRIWITGILVFLGLAGWIGLERAADNDEINQLRRYTPFGVHFIDTALTGGTVKWRSKEIVLWKVREKNAEYPSVEAFKAAFLKRSPHPKTSISVHHPALNLEKEDGRQSHDRAEAILAFLEENGYENAGVVAN